MAIRIVVMDSISALKSKRGIFYVQRQATRMFAGTLAIAWLLVLVLIPVEQADGSKHSREVQLAAAFELPQLPTKVPGLTSLTGPSADWRQFDSFFTFVVKRFGDDVPGNLKDSLADA